MALYQPSMIVPDVRNGIGYGVVDTSRNWTVSWHVNGPSALTEYQIDFYTNDAQSLLVYSTGKLSDGCPFYGTTPNGDMQSFTYKMPAVTLLSPSNSYKMVITQWWSATEYIKQNSASVFNVRTTPSLSVNPIGSGGTVEAQAYTFTGSYSQAQGDVLNWFRWQLADAENLGELLYDSGNISGTMDIQMAFDGLFTGCQYAVRLTAQTQSGAAADTGWVLFDVDYGIPMPSDNLQAACADGTNAVLITWSVDGGTLLTPQQIGTVTYDGSLQIPTFDNYDPNKMVMSGEINAVNAGTYTAAFTPQDGYDWLVANTDQWSIYRKGTDGSFTRLATIPADGGQLYDYGAASRQGPYTYYAFPIDDNGNIMDAPLVSNSINPCYQSWSLMECEENGDGFSVVEEYLFRYNFTSEALSNNNTPTINQNFTRYPTVQKSPQNYRSGSLTGLIGTVDGQSKYSDTLKLRQKLFALSTTSRTLFLKSRKGDLIKVCISEPTEAKMADESFEQQQSITIHWVEVGEVAKVLKLTSLSSASGDDNGSPELVLDPDYIVGNVGDTFTVNAFWRGNGALSAAPIASTDVTINGTTITVTKGTSGTEVIPVTVSQTAQYDAQTVPLKIQALAVEYLPIPTQSGTLTYNRNAQSPSWNDYDPAKMTIGGTTTGANAGSYNAVFIPHPGYEWVGGGSDAQVVAWTIGKASPNLSLSPAELRLLPNAQGTSTASWAGDGTLSATAASGASAAVSGTTVSVTAGAATGSVDVSVGVTETTNYLPGSATLSVTIAAAEKLVVPTQNGTLVYNGQVQQPVWNNYDSSKMELSGSTAATNAGNQFATFRPNPGYIWEDGTDEVKTVVWSIQKASPNLSVSPAELYLDVGETQTITATWSGNGTLSASSSSSAITSASVSGSSVRISGGSPGRASITVRVSETQNYTSDLRVAWAEVTGSASANVTITNGKNDGQYINVFYSDGDETTDFITNTAIYSGDSESFTVGKNSLIIIATKSSGYLQDGTGSSVEVPVSFTAAADGLYVYGYYSERTPYTYIITNGGTFTWR